MARLLGANQKPGWKTGHAIREMMDDRNHELLPLDDIVEVDEANVGAAPNRSQEPTKFVPDDQRTTPEPVLAVRTAPQGTTLRTVGSKSYIGIDRTMDENHRVSTVSTRIRQPGNRRPCRHGLGRD